MRKLYANQIRTRNGITFAIETILREEVEKRPNLVELRERTKNGLKKVRQKMEVLREDSVTTMKKLAEKIETINEEIRPDDRRIPC